MATEERRCCIDVLPQIGAVTTDLESRALQILDAHVNSRTG